MGACSHASGKCRFKTYPIGYFHLDITEVSTADGKLHLFVAIDRTSKFTVARLFERANTEAAVGFLSVLVESLPSRIHTVLTDNAIQFADLPKNRKGPTAMLRGHPFARACRRHGIEHRLAKPNNPWTNGQVEHMNLTIKNATVRTYHYSGHDQLRSHLRAFLKAYNFARRLTTLAGLTPYQYISSCFQNDPQRFAIDPLLLFTRPDN